MCPTQCFLSPSLSLILHLKIEKGNFHSSKVTYTVKHLHTHIYTEEAFFYSKILFNNYLFNIYYFSISFA